MTRSRPSMQKSTSKSGIETRSGFRKRSNSRSCSSGSRSVMPSAVGHQRAGARAAARAHRHAVLARPADEVGDDQEVAGEAHLADDLELARPARSRYAVRLRRRAGRERARKTARPTRLRRNSLGRHAGGHRVIRQPRLAQLQHQAAAARDLHASSRAPRAHRANSSAISRGRAQVLLRGVAAHARRIREQRAVVDAHARLVRFEIRRALRKRTSLVATTGTPRRAASATAAAM